MGEERSEFDRMTVHVNGGGKPKLSEAAHQYSDFPDDWPVDQFEEVLRLKTTAENGNPRYEPGSVSDWIIKRNFEIGGMRATLRLERSAPGTIDGIRAKINLTSADGQYVSDEDREMLIHALENAAPTYLHVLPRHNIESVQPAMLFEADGLHGLTVCFPSRYNDGGFGVRIEQEEGTIQALVNTLDQVARLYPTHEALVEGNESLAHIVKDQRHKTHTELCAPVADSVLAYLSQFADPNSGQLNVNMRDGDFRKGLQEAISAVEIPTKYDAAAEEGKRAVDRLKRKGSTGGCHTLG